ncbi:MAG: YfiR family protein [Hyphomonadaceae bacterium]
MSLRSVLASILTAILLGLAPAVRAQTSDELVKATFLYRFASFVTWPSGAFASADAPIVLCVIGADSFARALRTAARGQSVNGRSFEVRRLGDPAGARQCHAVYVAGFRAADTLRAVRGAPVLTVTDGAIGDEVRGVIHFVIVDDRVRFHIDDARAAEADLFLSSRLLSIAVSVRRRATA